MHNFTAQVWNGSRWHLWRWILVPFRLLNKNTGSFHLSDPSKSLWWNNVISGHVSVVPSKHLDRLLNVQNSAYKLQMFSPKPGSTHPPHQAYGVVAPTLSNSVLVENCKATSLDTFLKKLLETHLFTKAFDLYCPQRFSSMCLCLRIVFNFYFPIMKICLGYLERCYMNPMYYCCYYLHLVACWPGAHFNLCTAGQFHEEKQTHILKMHHMLFAKS